MNSSYHVEDISFTGELCEKHGVYETYYSNKNIKSLQSYVSGKLHGLTQHYDFYGNIQSEYFYKDGLLNGIVKIYHKPKIDNQIMGYEPRIHKTIIYQNDVKIGLEKVYLEDGTLLTSF
jgi:antitoxin component YwqK of YwqJK toxin-antitoxin module